ncbi:MAG: hypothetical protein CBR30_09815 [Dictyoglomus sp. NZ13-RE01]|nr:MAG: hypothetical protein CBR30_09815 [Dictyoglomus sp. NZ13-RE01]
MKAIHNKTTLSIFIENAYRNYGFVSAFIYGYQGSGKTTYALKTLYYLYGDWDTALNHLYFDIDKALETMRKAFSNNERIKAIVIDDAGYSLIKYDWRKEHSQWFSRFFNLARTVVSGIIFTSIETSDIIAFVREKIMYPVNVRAIDNLRSEARGYRIYFTPLMEKYAKKVFRDIYIRRLPQEVFEKYEKMRKEAISKLFDIEPKKKPESKPELDEDKLLENMKKQLGLP